MEASMAKAKKVLKITLTLATFVFIGFALITHDPVYAIVAAVNAILLLRKDE
jgi:hypothetical protein